MTYISLNSNLTHPMKIGTALDTYDRIVTFGVDVCVYTVRHQYIIINRKINTFFIFKIAEHGIGVKTS